MTTFGVVIPAYHGAGTIERSMTSLARQSFDGELSVVVAVNDDRSDTLRAAESLVPLLHAAGATCTVIRTPAGRSAAIRAAEERLPAGPRLYLDQDAALSPRAVAGLATALAPGSGVHFATPTLRFAPCRSRLTRAYYRVWQDLPYVRLSPVTVGAYAVSAEGRGRWGELPTLHSDDKFVRLRFAPDERRVLPAASYEVLVPDGLRALVQARRRYRRGNRELAGVSGAAEHTDRRARRRGVVGSLAARPARWPSTAVFLGVHAAAAVLDLWPGARAR